MGNATLLSDLMLMGGAFSILAARKLSLRTTKYVVHSQKENILGGRGGGCESNQADVFIYSCFAAHLSSEMVFPLLYALSRVVLCSRLCKIVSVRLSCIQRALL